MAARKFLFDLSFEPEGTSSQLPEPETVPVPEPEPQSPPEPTFSGAELSAAREGGYAQGREDGYRAGFEEGRAEGERTTERAVADALRLIAGTVSSRLKAVDDSRAAVAADAMAAALAITRKLLPELCRRHGLDEIEGLFRDCLEPLMAEPRIVVRTCDTLLDVARDRLEALAHEHGFTGRLVLVADPDLAPSDVRIEWADGGAERLTSAFWQGVDLAVERHLGHLPAPPSPIAPTPPAPARES